MAYKFVAFAAIVAVVQSAAVPIAPVVAAGPVAARIEEYDPHPQYSFAYNIQDTLTGDSKSQHEIREGDVVKGSYSLIEADGTRRVVNYVADPINGFNAVVSREPVIVKTAVPVAPAIAPARILAPAAPVVAAPARFAAPIAAPIAAPARLVAPAAAPLVARYAAAPARFAAPIAPFPGFAAAQFALPAAAPFAAAYVR